MNKGAGAIMVEGKSKEGLALAQWKVLENSEG